MASLLAGMSSRTEGQREELGRKEQRTGGRVPHSGLG